MKDLNVYSTPSIGKNVENENLVGEMYSFPVQVAKKENIPWSPEEDPKQESLQCSDLEDFQDLSGWCDLLSMDAPLKPELSANMPLKRECLMDLPSNTINSFNVPVGELAAPEVEPEVDLSLGNITDNFLNQEDKSSPVDVEETTLPDVLESFEWIEKVDCKDVQESSEEFDDRNPVRPSNLEPSYIIPSAKVKESTANVQPKQKSIVYQLSEVIGLDGKRVYVLHPCSMPVAVAGQHCNEAVGVTSRVQAKITKPVEEGVVFNTASATKGTQFNDIQSKAGGVLGTDSFQQDNRRPVPPDPGEVVYDLPPTPNCTQPPQTNRRPQLKLNLEQMLGQSTTSIDTPDIIQQFANGAPGDFDLLSYVFDEPAKVPSLLNSSRANATSLGGAAREKSDTTADLTASSVPVATDSTPQTLFPAAVTNLSIPSSVVYVDNSNVPSACVVAETSDLPSENFTINSDSPVVELSFNSVPEVSGWTGSLGSEVGPDWVDMVPEVGDWVESVVPAAADTPNVVFEMENVTTDSSSSPVSDATNTAASVNFVDAAVSFLAEALINDEVSSSKVVSNVSGFEMKRKTIAGQKRKSSGNRKAPLSKKMCLSTSRQTSNKKAFSSGRKSVSPSLSSLVSTDGDTETGDGKYRELRDKNNEASRKSRQNRRTKESEMQLKAEQLERENAILKMKAEELDKLVKSLRDALLQSIIKGRK